MWKRCGSEIARYSWKRGESKRVYDENNDRTIKYLTWWWSIQHIVLFTHIKMLPIVDISVRSFKSFFLLLHFNTTTFAFNIGNWFIFPSFSCTVCCILYHSTVAYICCWNCSFRWFFRFDCLAVKKMQTEKIRKCLFNRTIYYIIELVEVISSILYFILSEKAENWQ